MNIMKTVVGTFARRAWKNRAFASACPRGRGQYGFPWWGWLGLAMFLGWLPVVWLRPGWTARLQVHSFAIMGFGHAMLMDALACRRGAVSVFKVNWKGFLGLLPVSAAFWWFFEFLNRFSRNWYFINIGELVASLAVGGCNAYLRFRLGDVGLLASGEVGLFSSVPPSLLLRGNAAYRLRRILAVWHRGASGLWLAGVRR